VALGWRIRTDPNGHGVFHSHDILPGSQEWPIERGGVAHWADILFLAQGRQPDRFFNATLYTVAEQWAGELITMAEAAVEAKLSAEDRERVKPRAYTSKPDRLGFISMVFAPHQGLASLDGLTEEGAKAQWLRAHWEQRGTLVTVGERARFYGDYTYGVGLDLITAEPNLTTEAVVRAIEAFRARGEQPYQAPAEAFVTHQAAIDAILKARLWKWDAAQARVTGQPEPELDPACTAVLHIESNALRT